MKLHPSVAELLPLVTRLRRDLHRIPETGYEEFETQKYIMAYLSGLSPDYLAPIASTGVKAVFYCGVPDAMTTGFRADIDGLALCEENDLEFVSTHPGRMHACGHDGHTATLLTFATLVAQNRDRLKENVVLLFQPAEEHIGGAKRVIAEGGLENPRVDRIFGLHVWPDVPFGTIGVKEGPLMAQTCEFDIVVHGKSAHGASPHKGVDAIVAAAEIITALQTIVTRSVDPYEKALLTVGKIEGGVARNIIADKVVMNGTVRSFKNDVHERIKSRINDILSGMEKVCQVKCDFSEMMHYPVLSNPRELTDLVLSLTEHEGVMIMDEILAAEDFAFYQQQIPGMFFFVGIGKPDHKMRLHSPVFNFDESALLNGVEVYRRIVGL